jgi:hypothetical protein
MEVSKTLMFKKKSRIALVESENNFRTILAEPDCIKLLAPNGNLIHRRFKMIEVR